ncbi:hypothetical protein KOW79_000097 [Hemibagrus wyckioides]|uniref:Uncharacterized protein n=1 Tax=Hemibagrus wyckioides TaxID=337641 RepID=A0A9D3SCK1_9TELE|nr:hypothetical protein KOW79_000097 [Hemibagrus wyckioides]
MARHTAAAHGCQQHTAEAATTTASSTTTAAFLLLTRSRWLRTTQQRHTQLHTRRCSQHDAKITTAAAARRLSATASTGALRYHGASSNNDAQLHDQRRKQLARTRLPPPQLQPLSKLRKAHDASSYQRRSSHPIPRQSSPPHDSLSYTRLVQHTAKQVTCSTRRSSYHDEAVGACRAFTIQVHGSLCGHDGRATRQQHHTAAAAHGG